MIRRQSSPILSSVGRFINEDTYEGDIKNPLSLNLYTYVYNNPLIHLDPTGNFVYPVSPSLTYAVDMGIINQIWMHKLREVRLLQKMGLTSYFLMI
ncbi:RHS repeat-associated core domain-containing protein [Paenibacillus sp. cl6col]|nr:RHS repeat-associated core domain-containing protein [Paenibacillus sp. cl6col]